MKIGGKWSYTKASHFGGDPLLSLGKHCQYFFESKQIKKYLTAYDNAIL